MRKEVSTDSKRQLLQYEFVTQATLAEPADLLPSVRLSIGVDRI